MDDTQFDDDDLDKSTRVAKVLAENGFNNIVVLRQDVGKQMLTEKRRELIDYLKETNPDSVRALARALDRDKSGVSRDLTLLAEHQIVEFEENGAAKVPRLATDNVIIEPIV
jgi:predicted transcriptional regulator